MTTNTRNRSIVKVEVNGRKVQITGKNHSFIYDTQKTGEEKMIDGFVTFTKTIGVGSSAKVYTVFVK